MKKLLCLITILSLIGCGKDACDIGPNLPAITNQSIYDSDIIKINNYLSSKNLVANSTASGLHYIIVEAGSEKMPEQCDQVRVAYQGYLLNGTVFDSSLDVSFPLTNVIPGWREGIPLFGKGAKGTLLIPSYLAYGSVSPSPSIPSNSVLLFDIELKDF